MTQNPFTPPHIQAMTAYSPPLPGRHEYKGLLLDFNERTTPINPAVQDAIIEFLETGKLHLYPDYQDLVHQVATYAGVDANQVCITNGSSQSIDLIFRAFTAPKDEIVIPSPSFTMFYQYAAIQNTQVHKVAYHENGDFPIEEVLAYRDKPIKLLIICNPNNPSGTLISTEQIAQIADQLPRTIILVDEAYFEFAQTTAVSLLNTHLNIVISRTFSKAFGLPSLRIGYTLSTAPNIESMIKVRGPYDINIISAIAVSAALKNPSYMTHYREEVMTQSKPLVESFFRENNIRFLPSHANFITFFPENPQETHDILAQNGIRTRPTSHSLRVTIGALEQMQEFITTYNTHILKNLSK